MAGRYATALFELALESKAVDAVKADLETFDALVARERGPRRGWCAARCSPPRSRRKALAAVLDKAGISGLAAQFPAAWSRRNRRLFAVRDMIRGFRALVAAAQGRGDRRGHRRRAARPTRSSRRLKDALKAVTGKDVADRRQGRSVDHRRADRQGRLAA